MVLALESFYRRGMRLHRGRSCSSCVWAAALFTVIFTGERVGTASSNPIYVGSAAEHRARQSGWRTIDVLRVDLTGDGRREDAVVQAAANALRLLVVSYRGGDVEDEPEAFATLYEERISARRVVQLESRPLAGDPTTDLIAVFESPAPDERSMTVRMLGQRNRVLTTFFAKNYAIAQNSTLLGYGDASPHFTFEDRDGDGTAEVIWTLGPATLSVTGPDGPIPLAIGARRQVYRFRPTTGRYTPEGDEQVSEFLPRHVPTAVEASQQVPKIWGTAQAFWGADGQLETAWMLRRTTAKGQTLTLRIDGRPVVSMIRVVPGCGANAREWANHHRLQRFRIRLSTGLQFDVRSDGRGPWPPGVRGIGVFPLDGDYGQQILIFLETPEQTAWGQLEVLALRPSRISMRTGIDEVCVSDVSFH